MSHDNNEKTAEFQIPSHLFDVSFENLNTIMQTPRKGPLFYTMPYPDEFEEDFFWGEITSESSLTLGRDRVNHIIHPCIQLANRILVCLIFSRKEISQIMKAELFSFGV